MLLMYVLILPVLLVLSQNNRADKGKDLREMPLRIKNQENK